VEVGFVLDEEALKRGEKMFRQDCRFVRGAQTTGDLPPDGLPEVAFAGRSNVGKSSLINALTGRKALARASNTPGRTQQINFFQLGEDMHLADLPGYGYAVASKHKIERWNDMIRTYLRERRALMRVCVLIDARHGIMAVDQDTMEMLDSAHVAYVVVLTKADKTKPTELAKLVARIETELKSYKGAFPAVYATSSATREGIAELRAILAMF
jgi:GTP-binding protein